jgi:hypothetical protein
MSETWNVPAGWYPDDAAPGTIRYWDGTGWTQHRAAPQRPRGYRQRWREANKVIEIVMLAVGVVIALATFPTDEEPGVSASYQIGQMVGHMIWVVVPMLVLGAAVAAVVAAFTSDRN